MTGKNNTARITAIVLTIVLASAVVLPTQAASAATIKVKSTSDGTGGPDCTLRDAITAANTDTATGGCPAGSGADTIVLANGATYTLTEVDNSTYGPNGLPVINSEITLEGQGSIIKRSNTNGMPEFRIVHVAMDGNLTLNEVTVFNGRTSNEPGGGIYNKGTLTMINTTIIGNKARGGGGIFNDASGSMDIDSSIISYNIELFTPPVGFAGGGIRNDGTATITNSIIKYNNALNGGGIYNIWDGVVTLINCTVSNNSATAHAGGIGNVGDMTLNNTTISGNTAGEMGGGIYSIGRVTLTNSTISDNSAGVYGGGIYNYPGKGGTVELTNTIVAAQRSGADCFGDPVTSLSYNLDSDGSCSLSAPGDLSGFDPLLGPLSDNGGATWTHSLLPGSPAIDTVPVTNCVVTTDQRGVSRPQGVACDIGSFEVEYTGVVYTITDLGPLEWSESMARAINNRGQIAGFGYPEYDLARSIIWEKGTVTDLGSLGADDCDEPNNNANGINDSGQLVGISAIENCSEHAYLWQQGTMMDLGTLGGRFSNAMDINNRSQIVGASSTSYGDSHAFLWDSGVMTDLGTLGGSHSNAHSINELGQIVGTSDLSVGGIRAFMWENGEMINLGALGTAGSRAFDINNRGQIVGVSYLQTVNNWRAFIWENGTMTDLGTLGGDNSSAYGINERGQIVGSSQTSSGEQHAFLWDKGTMIDLGTLGGDVSAALDINEVGQIVGQCRTVENEPHACMWEIDH